MQVAADSGESGAGNAPAAGISDGAVTPKRFYSAEAAAKHWANGWGIVVRPGGYLHTTTPELYNELPDWLRGNKGQLSEEIYRLYDHKGGGSVRGWTHLGHALLRDDRMYTQKGPRGATQYYLREE